MIFKGIRSYEDRYRTIIENTCYRYVIYPNYKGLPEYVLIRKKHGIFYEYKRHATVREFVLKLNTTGDRLYVVSSGNGNYKQCGISFDVYKPHYPYLIYLYELSRGAIYFSRTEDSNKPYRNKLKKFIY